MATKRKGTIEVWKSKKDNKFYFHLLSSNGKIVLPAGQGYNRRVDLIKTLQAVSDIFKEGRFVIKDATLAAGEEVTPEEQKCIDAFKAALSTAEAVGGYVVITVATAQFIAAKLAEAPVHNLVAAMIVKNEEPVIDRCVQSVAPYVDKIYADDNGSTDATVDYLRAAGADVLAGTAWVDFASNRNAVLARASHEGKYVLCGIDADETLVVPEGFVWPEFTESGYKLAVHYHDLRYRRTAIVSPRCDWFWKGVIHETLVCRIPDAEAPLINGPYILVHTDALGARARDPDTGLKDLAVLHRAVMDEPANARYRFYLAQTLKDLRRYAEAHDNYVMRARMLGWPPETAWATYMAGVTDSWRHIDPMPWYAEAIKLDPTRAEFFVSAARWYRINSNWPMAFLFAKHAAYMPDMGSPLFSEADVYEWLALDELVMAAYYTGNIDEGRRAAALLQERNFPEHERERITNNIAFFN